jgi:hypothetical protein
MESAALLRSLLLPISDEDFARAVAELDRFFDQSSVAESDRGAVIESFLANWETNSIPGAALTRLVRAILQSSSQLESSFAAKYFTTLERLQSSSLLLTFAQARGLLSNSLLIDNMLRRERMSAAQTALVINASQHEAYITWAHVQAVADALGIRPKLTRDELDSVHEDDFSREPLTFADASPTDSIVILAGHALSLGYPGNLAAHLDGFLDKNTGFFESTFAIFLHFNALVTQFYNHPLSQAAYEFEPRGQMVADVMRQIHPSYQAAASPFLNNAKGAFAFDSNWAWGRMEGNRQQAHAMVLILEGLSEMAYAPRRELASLIRQWLIRIERLRGERFVTVDTPDFDAANNAIDGIKRANTGTQGVLEQRLIDLVVSHKYPESDGWRIRGVGDSVNASNVAKRKLGDVDAQNAQNRTLIALEPHGGTLTQVYVDLHQNTLAQVLKMRAAEFELFAAREDWSVEVVFIAHAVGRLVTKTERIEGFETTYRFMTYDEYLDGFDWPRNLVEEFAKAVVEPTARAWVPDHIKQRLNDLMQG